MNKDTFRGLVIGVIITFIIGYGILYVRGLGQRLTTLEVFIQRIIENSNKAQASRPMPRSIPQVQPQPKGVK